VLARGRNDDVATARARQRVDEAIELLGSQRLTAGLFAGFTGIAWATELVDDLLGRPDEDRNEAVDEAVAGLLRRPPRDEAPYDLIHGLVGIGVYCLRRWPRQVAVQSLEAVVDQLAGRSRSDENGTFWWTPPTLLFGPKREMFPAGGVDLGVAHGIAGVLPLLARAHALGVRRATTASLLEGVAGWLSARLVDAPWGRTLPAFVAEDAVPRPARSAWCYGDPGVATVLLLAARDTGENALAALGLELATSSAARPSELAGVTDAGLCHGSAGLTHLFGRMHQLTGSDQLAAAARFWAERTVDDCSAALESGTPAARLPWSGPGLLEGAGGIMLALEAAATSTDPGWDAMFLVATPPIAPGEPR
jgi:hypothetical protein